MQRLRAGLYMTNLNPGKIIPKRPQIRYTWTRIPPLMVWNPLSTDKDLVILEASNPLFSGLTFIGASGVLSNHLFPIWESHRSVRHVKWVFFSDRAVNYYWLCIQRRPTDPPSDNAIRCRRADSKLLPRCPPRQIFWTSFCPKHNGKHQQYAEIGEADWGSVLI